MFIPVLLVRDRTVLLRIMMLVPLLGLSCLGLSQPGRDLFDLPDDSNKVRQIMDLAFTLEIDNPDSAIILYEKAAGIAESISYGIGAGRASQYAGIVNSDQGRFDTALVYYEKAIGIFHEIGYLGGVAATLVNIGNIYQLRAEYTRSADYYFQGIKIYEQLGDSIHLAYALTNLGGIFSDLEQFDKALTYFRQSLGISQGTGDSTNLVDCLINIGVIQLKRNELVEAKGSLHEALDIAVHVNDPYHFHLIYDGLSEIATRQGRNLEALHDSRLCLKYSELLGNPALVSLAMARIGMNLNRLDDTDSAAFYLAGGIRLARENHANEVLIVACQWMADLQEKKKDYHAAVEWMKRHHALQDSAAGQRQKKIISGLNIAYETEKKDLELSEKTMEIERNQALLAKRSAFIIALSGALASAFVFLFMVQRSLRQKRIIAEKEAALQKEKLDQLQRKQEVLALQSMLDGQEKERRRLAKDLHDGLGGLLSTVRIYFSKLADSYNGLSDSGDYGKAMELLDNTAGEARKIAHNMMPEALVRFGLGEALTDFCNNISQAGGLKIDLQVYGLEERLPPTMEVMVYRIVQELVNNVVKHADAHEVIVQLMKDNGSLHLTVEDDGRGFDPGDVGGGSAGLGNIRSRVRFLDGTMEIESEEGKGTTCTLTLPMGATDEKTGKPEQT